VRKFVIPAAIVLGISSLGSRVIGIIRDHLLTHRFGATREVFDTFSQLDLYYAAFRLPDFIYNLLILGTVSSVFIPVFAGLIQKNKEEAWKIAAVVMNLVLIVTIGLCFALAVFAPYIMPYFTFGFPDEAIVETVKLTRIMLFTPLLFGLSAVATSILNSFHRFTAMSFSPLLYNLGIIGGILYLEPIYGIAGVAFGVLIGAALHLLVQLPSVFAVGYRPSLSLDLSHPRLRKMGSMMVPRILSLSVNQVNLVINTAIASSFVVGSVTVLNLAINLQSLPVGVIGLSVAVATFSSLAQIASNGKLDEFAERISVTMRMILFLVIPAAAGMIQLRTELVRLILGSGSFNWTDTVMTANTLGYLCIGLFAVALLPLISRAFYALEDTYTPLKVSLVSIGLNLVLALLFGIYLDMGVQGLALAVSISAVFNFSVLFFALHDKLGQRLHLSDIFTSTLKILFATFVMMAFVQLTKWHIGIRVDMETFFGVFLKTSLSAMVGVLIYITAAHLLSCREVGEVWKRFRPEHTAAQPTPIDTPDDEFTT